MTKYAVEKGYLCLLNNSFRSCAHECKLRAGRLYIGRCNGYWSADRCVMQRYGDESVVVAIATLFNNNKMAGTLEQEAFEKKY